MPTIELTGESFQKAIAANETVLIDFWASWCGPCRAFGPVFEKASDGHPDLVFAKVNTEDQHELAAAFGIRSIPTLMVLRDQIVLYSQPGALPAPMLEDLIEQVRAVDMDAVRRAIAEHDGRDPGRRHP